MRKKHKPLEDCNYWPGYVDGLVNVVLNIVFLVGVMTVGLISLNMEALGNSKLARQAEQLYQINEENMLLAALGTFIAVIPEVPTPPTPPTLVPPTPPPVQVVQPAPVLRPEPPKAEPARPITALRVGRPQPMPVLVEEKQQLSERLQWGDQATIGVLEFEPFVFKISTTQIDQIRQLVAQANAGRWSLAIAVDGNETTARESFWRLTQVRQQLLLAGVPQEAIALRMVNMLQPSTGSSRRVFIAHLRII